MHVRLSLVKLGLALGTLSSPVELDEVAIIQNDFTNINTKTKSLDTSITAFPNSGGSILQALSIHRAAISLAQVIESATGDANACAPFNETDGNAILVLVKELVPVIQQTATNIVSKKVALAGLPIGGATSIVLSDLKTLKRDTDAFIVAVLAKAPAALMDAAQEQATLVSSALGNAIATYS